MFFVFVFVCVCVCVLNEESGRLARMVDECKWFRVSTEDETRWKQRRLRHVTAYVGWPKLRGNGCPKCADGSE